MKELLWLISIFSIALGCNRDIEIKDLKGYVVYKLPNYVIFVETKTEADSNYVEHFSNKNFSKAIWFKPNCEIERKISEIKPDSLYNEDPGMKEYSVFLRDPLIFPAKIKLLDTANYKSKDLANHRFKMIYKGKLVEFVYRDFNGVVIDLEGLDR